MVRLSLNRLEVTQDPITPEHINTLLTLTPRRMKLAADWPKVLHEPSAPGKDWTIVLPFRETFANTFRAGCHVQTIGLRPGKGDRCYTFLKGADDDPAILETVRSWVKTVDLYVGIRARLVATFALDFDRIGGDPLSAHSAIGELRVRAKPYDTDPTNDTYAAAAELADHIHAFQQTIDLYQYTDVVVGMPPSTPDRPFNLPAHLAKSLTQKIDKPDWTDRVQTTVKRPSLKSKPMSEKLGAITGTVSVKPDDWDGRTVLLVDDLYQSGVSMNYVAMLILEAGAARVLGLSCVKTCRNDDNIGDRS